MNAPPTLQRITQPLARLTSDTRRECELVRKRAETPAEFTFADSTELMRLQRAAQLRADELAEQHNEARTFKNHHLNRHGE